MNLSHVKLGCASALFLPLSLLLGGCHQRSAMAENPPATAPDTTAAAPVASTPNFAATNEADNSGRNVRDRNNNNPTAGDQGNSDADREITQKIRQSIVSGTNDFSMTAKNVKIITTNGKVTLRGPVQTEAEKTSIASIAKGIAGEGSVDDQLEVKTNP
jgi:osmotically-inducible protein OsmY